ncbi:hypothetical protein [uncultured Alsobacter sp.]|uniref:hypothetical protein n=1 Tax=uncultured Alsobacter sp. TaxID=1748258 RepID=UPI0025F8470C|nr:hypothetical protein [uncultured Alsobacter sp.]
MSEATTTTDHDEIRRWTEARGGRPSRVRGSADKGGAGKNGPGILRLDFGEPDDSLEEISWDDFFEIFEASELALLHQDKTSDGKQSRFNKLVHRNDKG